MKKNYELAGMSCGGCVNNVKQALLKVPDVTGAAVQLHPQTAVVTMNKSIDVGDLQTQLSKAGHYSIKEVA
jgi:copper chaperone